MVDAGSEFLSSLNFAATSLDLISIATSSQPRSLSTGSGTHMPLRLSDPASEEGGVVQFKPSSWPSSFNVQYLSTLIQIYPDNNRRCVSVNRGSFWF
jgi:hypothetical protein